MGLIDDARERRDSWNKRYEEHRTETEEYDHRFEKENEEAIQRKIKENCEKVGKFEPLNR